MCVNDVSVHTMAPLELGWNENSFIFAEETERGQNYFIKCEWEWKGKKKLAGKAEIDGQVASLACSLQGFIARLLGEERKERETWAITPANVEDHLS